MSIFKRKTDAELHDEAKLAGQSAKRLTPAQKVALQVKASDARNKRRGK